VSGVGAVVGAVWAIAEVRARQNIARVETTAVLFTYIRILLGDFS